MTISVSPNAGIQEGTQCTKCKNEWALKTSIVLLYVLCTLLTIAVAVLGYKGTESRLLTSPTAGADATASPLIQLLCS